MDAARELMETESEPVVAASVQISGRGRQGREWLSPEGGLWCSVVWERVSGRVVPYLFLLAGAAVVDLLASLDIETRMKLPNDVLHGNRKIAGLLIEKSGESVIIGVGINVNNQMSALRGDATSCIEITGKREDLRRMLGCLLAILEDYRTRFPHQERIFLRKWGELLKK